MWQFCRWVSTGCHLIGSLVNSLSSSEATTCGRFVVVVVNFRSGTLSGTPTEMTASMGSSTHVFFSQRVQLNVHVAKTSMWLLDVRSPRSEAQCRGGDRQGAFNRARRIVMSVHLLESTWFSHSRWCSCLSSHSFPCRQNFDNTGAVVCDSTSAATCALAWVL